jgi:putative membrane protein
MRGRPAGGLDAAHTAWQSRGVPGFLARVVVSAVALWIVDAFFDSIWVTPLGGGALDKVAVYAVIGLVLTLVNSIIKPVVKVLAIPAMILTLGLFALVVNAAMLELVSWITTKTPIGLHIGSFGSAVWAGLVLAILTALLSIPFKPRRQTR